LILYLDKGQGFLRHVFVHRGHHGDIIADKAGGIHQEGHVMMAAAGGLIPGKVGDVFGGNDGLDPGKGFGLLRIDAYYFGVGMGAPQGLSVKHSRKIDVGSIFGLPADPFPAIDFRVTFSYDL
jgi:hypothetical protein